mmetsp:Transcript_116234/g.311524  ORF Transcript_116234/g.311524 Transcript_116234/m.311524 type:complete len:234 (+) Transcript_116234:280-981(+)
MQRSAAGVLPPLAALPRQHAPLHGLLGVAAAREQRGAGGGAHRGRCRGLSSIAAAGTRKVAEDARAAVCAAERLPGGDRPPDRACLLRVGAQRHFPGGRPWHAVRPTGRHLRGQPGIGVQRGQLPARVRRHGAGHRQLVWHCAGPALRQQRLRGHAIRGVARPLGGGVAAHRGEDPGRRVRAAPAQLAERDLLRPRSGPPRECSGSVPAAGAGVRRWRGRAARQRLASPGGVQ